MKGFMFYEPGKGEVVEVEKKRPGLGEVLVKVHYCGICGTDMNIWRGTDRSEKGIVLGHEYCGTITETGEGVEGFRVGDRVAVDPNIPCHQCEFCRKGRINLCTHLTALGVDINGGFEEYCIVPVNQLYLLPDTMSFEEAALVEPVACALNGIRRAGIEIGDDVLVLGGGPMGLLMVQLAKLRGAGRIILCEKMDGRRELGKQLGADLVIDSLERYEELSVGAPDVVIECIGNPVTQEKALQAVKKGGQVVLFGDGDLTKTFSVTSQLFYEKELQAMGAALNPFTHLQAFRIIESGKMNLLPLVSRKITVDELKGVLEQGYQKDDIKILVSFE